MNNEPGTYNIFNSQGECVGWQRHSKDARLHAASIGGTALKVPKSQRQECPVNDTIKMPDGTFAPMTRANIKLATGRK
jgi:hypothetical protein